jgi:hypothetical protein
MHYRNCLSYENLKMSVEKRLLDSVKVFHPKQWPEDVGSRVTYGEAEIREMS